MTNKSLDLRLNAFRPDLADKQLEGRVAAARFVEGETMRVVSPVADVLREPSPESAMDTQFLAGETVRVFDEREGWAWVQGDRDGYVGYIAAEALGPANGKPTHLVCKPRTFLYRGPDLKTPRVTNLSLGCGVEVVGEAETRGTSYAQLASGTYAITAHLRTPDEHASDYVTIAETLIATPYLWGGTSAFGVDCSGLVQLALRMAGETVLRDTGMQETTIGEPVGAGDLKRGDLVFWSGHVGIMTDGKMLLHASGHTMMVTREPFEDAIARIRHLYSEPTSYRRP